MEKHIHILVFLRPGGLDRIVAWSEDPQELEEFWAEIPDRKATRPQGHPGALHFIKEGDIVKYYKGYFWSAHEVLQLGHAKNPGVK